MFQQFFLALREARVPVSLTEYLTLLEAVARGAAGFSPEQFYYLSRACLVKDERHIDKFDRVFAQNFHGLGGDDPAAPDLEATIPGDWLKALAERLLSPEEKEKIQALGGFEALIETLLRRIREQTGAHHGGGKWIGTGGTSPFGAMGYHPEGVRIGQPESRHRRAAKVWDRRDFRNFDDGIELNTRGFKMALRRLRRFARQGAADELDLGGTIHATAARGGLLDLKMVPERHNAVKILLLLDSGGSMDDHVALCERLFSAACAEFKHLEHFYFHNCVYDALWRDAGRRRRDEMPLHRLLNTYGADYRLIIVGDATMSPYELTEPGGALDSWNALPGAACLQRLLEGYPHAVWLNPLPEISWRWNGSIEMIQRLMGGRMYSLTLEGLDNAMRSLSH